MNKEKTSRKKTAPKDKITPQKKALNYQKEKKRLLAEMDNLQKMHNQRLQEIRKFGNHQLVEELLEVINNFELALKFPVKNAETKNFFLGIKMTYDKLMKILKSEGLTPILCKIGNTFDDRWHEVFDTKWDKKQASGKILKIIQTGYQLYDRVLQPTKIIVNRQPNLKTNKKHLDSKGKEKNM